MKNNLNVLIVDSGGRGHALAWKIRQSPRVKELYVIPGNGGTRSLAGSFPIKPGDTEALFSFSLRRKIDLAVVGTEEAFGVSDRFADYGIKVFGPSEAAAEIESSKAFAKKFMTFEGIPTPAYSLFRDYNKAVKHVWDQKLPIVVKDSRLAQGKGVTVAETRAQAEEALWKIMSRRRDWEAVVEEFVAGRELSIHVLSDGLIAKFLPVVQDHKAIGEGGVGPNTGGMGAYGPVPWVDSDLLMRIKQQVVKPALDGLKKMGRPFVGCLFPGLKIAPDGSIKVLEFNARPGDPETQVLMRLLETDLVDILAAGVSGKLNDMAISWHQGFAVCVVLASAGYPGQYRIGFPISGIAEAEKVPGVVVFHAGTVRRGNNFYTAGGRVLSVTAEAGTLEEARQRAYEAVSLISFEGMQYRKDIAEPALG